MDIIYKKRSIRTVLIVILLLITVVSLFGEKVAYQNGLGWDGVWYFSVCQDFSHKILHHAYDTYRLQRILPFAFINIVTALLGITPTIANCTMFISALNLLMVMLSAFIFFRISDFLKLCLPIEIFGYSALFFNYSILKQMGYHPFTTDIAAFTIALSQVYFFIRTKKVPFPLIIASAFVWQTLFLTGLIFAYMPSNAIIETDPASKKDAIFLNTIKFLIMSFVPFVAIMSLTAFFIIYGNLFKFKHFYAGDHFTNIYMFAVSLACIIFYFWYMFKPITCSPTKQLKFFFTCLSGCE